MVVVGAVTKTLASVNLDLVQRTVLRVSCQLQSRSIRFSFFVFVESCPTGTAWVDKPKGLNQAHGKMECSNRGNCDRKLGACKCFQGYEGTACERSTCNCNGHGKCTTTNAMYQNYLTNMTYYSQDYQLWDGESTTGCVCDIGYTGSACSMSKFQYLLRSLLLKLIHFAQKFVRRVMIH